MYFDDDDADTVSVTKLALANAFAGLPADTVRMMAGLNVVPGSARRRGSRRAAEG